MNNKIIWLASYPKSGNTWLRYLISNYFFNSERKFNFKIAKAIKNFPTEDHMKFIVNRSEIIKNPYSISNYWIQAQERAEVGGDFAFFKTHSGNVNVNKNLYTNDSPNPDILIRTGNTKRLSNFLLWQIAYTEIFFEKKLWPEFSIKDYNRILEKFKQLKRNFGSIE